MNNLKVLLLGLLAFNAVAADYFIVRDSDTVVTGVFKADPGVAPILHTKYFETAAVDISGWNSGTTITRTGVNTYVKTSEVFQKTSFAVNDIANSKLWTHRINGTVYDFSNPFTVLIPFKAAWATGPTFAFLFDLSSVFYVYLKNGGTSLVTRLFDATSNESPAYTLPTALVDNQWVWVGITYDGAGGFQYILDGTLIANTGSKVLVNNASIFKFGERSGFTVSQDMAMGNILILNKVISAAELTAYYNGGVSVDARNVFLDSEIVHYYRSDLMQQTTVLDSGGISSLLRGASTQNGLLTTIDVPN